MSASLRSTRLTVESEPGEPKLVDLRIGERGPSSELPTLAPSGKSGKLGSLDILTVYRRNRLEAVQLLALVALLGGAASPHTVQRGCRRQPFTSASA